MAQFPKYAIVGTAWSLLTLVLAGCGGDPSTQATQSGTNNESEQNVPSSEPAASTDSGTLANSNGSLIQNRDGTKWIVDVPLDVWYDNPLQVAAQEGAATPVAAPTANPSEPTQVATNTTPNAKPEPMPSDNVPSGGTDWKRIIPAELLDAEVTTIRNRFNADLQTVGAYNSSYLALPPHAATLSALAHIAKQHPDEIRWKENSKYIKHLAGAMIAEPLRRGPSSQKPLKEKFDNILEILNGSVPATLEAPPDDEAIAELAEMGTLMKRLENCLKLIRVDGGTEDAMKAKSKEIMQEAAVMGALTQVLLDGYGFEDDEGFAKFVKDMVDATVEMRESVQNEQFEKFDLGVSKATQACQQCHSEYRG